MNPLTEEDIINECSCRCYSAEDEAKLDKYFYVKDVLSTVKSLNKTLIETGKDFKHHLDTRDWIRFTQGLESALNSIEEHFPNLIDSCLAIQTNENTEEASGCKQAHKYKSSSVSNNFGCTCTKCHSVLFSLRKLFQHNEDCDCRLFSFNKKEKYFTLTETSSSTGIAIQSENTEEDSKDVPQTTSKEIKNFSSSVSSPILFNVDLSNCAGVSPAKKLWICPTCKYIFNKDRSCSECGSTLELY